MGMSVGKGYGLVRIRECIVRERKSVLEETRAYSPLDSELDLPPGYTLDTSNQDAYLLRRADRSLVCAFVPQHASAEIIRRVARRDNLLATGRRALDHHRWFSG